MNLEKFTTIHLLLQVTVLAQIRTSHLLHVSFFPLLHFSIKSSIFVLNLNQIHSTFCKTYALNVCKISGEITIFSGESGDFFVSSPLTLEVKLHKFTAFKKVSKRCMIIHG